MKPKNYFTTMALMLWILPALAVTRPDTSKIPIPIRNRVVNYVQACTSTAPSSKQFKQALQWAEATFKGNGQEIKTKDASSGKITATGIFRIATSSTGHYFWLRFNVEISVSDAGSQLSLLNYYEKPIEPGISNEYSKIEYRWWDFRRGKPWSAEDEPLFEGLNGETRTLMASFQKVMEQTTSK